jgi:hypothetical protein
MQKKWRKSAFLTSKQLKKLTTMINKSVTKSNGVAITPY